MTAWMFSRVLYHLSNASAELLCGPSRLHLPHEEATVIIFRGRARSHGWNLGRSWPRWAKAYLRDELSLMVRLTVRRS